MHSDEDLLSELFQRTELHNYFEAFFYQLSRLYTENPKNLGFPHRPSILLTKFAVQDNWLITKQGLIAIWEKTVGFMFTTYC